nr:54s ribosomal protein l11, mitochondrial [Quercus suber]
MTRAKSESSRSRIKSLLISLYIQINMPPRIHLPVRTLRLHSPSPVYVCQQCRHASLATTPAPSLHHETATPMLRYPASQPPSHKPPEFRKSQLHRQYQSVLRSSPLMLLFQHNNLKAVEWMGIRRELASALQKVDSELAANGNSASASGGIKLSVVQTGIFASALKVVEFWNPNYEPGQSPMDAVTPHSTDPSISSSTELPNVTSNPSDPAFMHGLSKQAWLESKYAARKQRHGLEPFMSGPIAILTFPSVSPQHLKVALSILAPSKDFPAPKRRVAAGYYEAPVQNGLQKLMLLGARVEGKVFDTDGAKWVGGIQGGLDGLRAQLVAMLGGVAGGITSTLEAASKSLYLTMESRRSVLEEGEKNESGSKD